MILLDSHGVLLKSSEKSSNICMLKFLFFMNFTSLTNIDFSIKPAACLVLIYEL